MKPTDMHNHRDKVSACRCFSAIDLELNVTSFHFFTRKNGNPNVILSYKEAKSLALELLSLVENAPNQPTPVVDEEYSASPQMSMGHGQS